MFTVMIVYFIHLDYLRINQEKMQTCFILRIIIVGLETSIVWWDHKLHKFLCDGCLNHFYSEEKLKIYEENCKNKETDAIIKPKNIEVILFKIV